MRALATQMCHEADATRIVLEAGVVESLRLGKRERRRWRHLGRHRQSAPSWSLLSDSVANAERAPPVIRERPFASGGSIISRALSPVSFVVRERMKTVGMSQGVRAHAELTWLFCEKQPHWLINCPHPGR